MAFAAAEANSLQRLGQSGAHGVLMATHLSLKKVLKIIGDPRLAAALLNAQIQLRRRAVVPLSVRLRGKVYFAARGEVVFGEGVALCGNVVPIEFVSHKGARISVGDHTFINYGASISANKLVSIGRHCLLGHYTFILDNNQHDLRQHNVTPPSAPVIIEDHVWIGSRSIILPGVHIGHNAAIGAGSVVVEDVPPWSLAVGNPARVVRCLDGQSLGSENGSGMR